MVDELVEMSSKPSWSGCERPQSIRALSPRGGVVSSQEKVSSCLPCSRIVPVSGAGWHTWIGLHWELGQGQAQSRTRSPN